LEFVVKTELKAENILDAFFNITKKGL